MFMSVGEPPYRNVWLKFDPKRLKLFLSPPPPFPETVYCSIPFQFVLPGQGRLGGPWSGPWACLPGSRSYSAPVGDGCVIQCV